MCVKGARARDSLPRQPSAEEESLDKSERTGVFTSGIVSTRAGQKIALFFTGHRHAGENLATVLARRAQELGPPIQMCDALARNLPKEFQAVVANCIAHGRRRFVEVAAKFPEECRYVMETLGEVYKHDAFCREQGMSAEGRLGHHQTYSGPRMKELEQWFREQFVERKVEPNSGLGQAITYMQNHWQQLTLFLRQAGAPLDHNLCERALKKAILHRKNALFYKTQNGAHVGDLFMSLIHTCQLCGANPFDYLTALQQHGEALSRSPQQWMPWNYPTPAPHQPKVPSRIGCFHLAENDRLRPGLGDTLKWAPNGPFRRLNPTAFLARHGRRQECCGLACMLVCPPTIYNEAVLDARPEEQAMSWCYSILMR